MYQVFTWIFRAVQESLQKNPYAVVHKNCAAVHKNYLSITILQGTVAGKQYSGTQRTITNFVLRHPLFVYWLSHHI